MYRIEPLEDGDILIKIPMSLRSVAGRRLIVTPGSPDKMSADIQRHPVLQALARAYYWQKLIDSGETESATAIATSLGIDISYITRIMRLTILSPKIVRLFLTGQAPDHISLSMLTRCVLPEKWDEQETMLLGQKLTE
jgi:hypothetical protein